LNWANIKRLMIAPAVLKLLLRDNIPDNPDPEQLWKQIIPFYTHFVNIVSGIREISFLFGKGSQFAIRASDNFKLISGLLPMKQDIPELLKTIELSADVDRCVAGELFKNVGIYKYDNSGRYKSLMVGLDGAGKTTILYKLKQGEGLGEITPTVGFNVEKISVANGVDLTIWDLGGKENIRPLWKFYYRGIKLIVFVLDSTDRERIGEAKKEIENLVHENELSYVTTLILCNKQDLPNAMSVEEIKNALQLSISNTWEAFGVCALTGAGFDEAFGWTKSYRY